MLSSNNNCYNSSNNSNSYNRMWSLRLIQSMETQSMEFTRSMILIFISISTQQMEKIQTSIY